MSAIHTAYLHHDRGKQRGAILLIMLVLLVISIAAILVTSLSSSSVKNARQATTAAALVQAKEALIGYAVSDNNRPGELPCPDSNDDGMVTIADYSGSNCLSLIGRLPWKTLGLPDLRDGYGEHLWYALSDPFHANGSTPINSNTTGTLEVYGPDGTTLQTQPGYSAVAVVFSAGSPVGSQTRNTAADQSNPANYLDSANGRNNSSASGPYIAGNETATFNDQLLYITTEELIPQVEMRVAAELKKALGNYRSAHGYYPYADSVPGPASYQSNYGYNWGWLPDNASTNTSTGSTPDWSGSARPPQWFFDNQWYAVIFYSVGKNYVQCPGGYSCSGPPPGCDPDSNSVNNSGCSSSSLYLDGVSGVQALFIMPGTPGTTTRLIDTLSGYLDDPQNNPQTTGGFGPSHTADHFVTPASTAKDRDRLYTLP